MESWPTYLDEYEKLLIRMSTPRSVLLSLSVIATFLQETLLFFFFFFFSLMFFCKLSYVNQWVSSERTLFCCFSFPQIFTQTHNYFELFASNLYDPPIFRILFLGFKFWEICFLKNLHHFHSFKLLRDWIDTQSGNWLLCDPVKRLFLILINPPIFRGFQECPRSHSLPSSSCRVMIDNAGCSNATRVMVCHLLLGVPPP